MSGVEGHTQCRTVVSPETALGAVNIYPYIVGCSAAGAGAGAGAGADIAAAVSGSGAGVGFELAQP